MKYMGIIFDLDGVLCSTDQFHYRAWSVIADKLAIPFDEQVNNRLRGVSRMESLAIILEQYEGPPLSQDERMALAEEKNGIYRQLLHTMGPADLAPDVKYTLDTLREKGCKLAVGSSSRNTPLILERLGLAGFFDAVADGNDITHSKPDPEVFLLAARRLGLPPGDCLVVEDAHAGIEAAVRGGFDAAGIGDAAGAKDARYRLEKLSDLLGILA